MVAEHFDGNERTLKLNAPADDHTAQKLQDDANSPPAHLYVLKDGIPLQKDNSMQPQPDAATTQLYDQVSPAVVKVVVPDGAGSGFFFDKNGDIATDAHVVLGENQVDVVLKDGSVHPAKVTRLDDVKDIAVLHIDGGTPAGIQVPGMNPDEKIKPDDSLWALGHPQGLDPIYVSPGYYQSDTTPVDIINGEGKTEIVKANETLAGMTPKERADAKEALTRTLEQGRIHVEPGNSGGPVIDANGDVVALTDMTGGGNETEITPVSDLIALMNENPSKFTFTYQFVPKAKVGENAVAPNGEYILTDVNRADGSYRPPYSDPFFEDGKYTPKPKSPALPSLPGKPNKDCRWPTQDSYEHYIPRAGNL